MPIRGPDMPIDTRMVPYPGLRLGRADHGADGRLLPLQPVQGRLYGAHRHDLRAQPRSPAQVGLRDVPACDGPQGHILDATRQGNRDHAKVGLVRPAPAARSLRRPDLKKLAGIIEIDETFVGGKEANKHEHKKLKAGRGPVGKTPVLGMRERGGRTVAMPIAGTDAQTIQPRSCRMSRSVRPSTPMKPAPMSALAACSSITIRSITARRICPRRRDHRTASRAFSRFLSAALIGVYHHASPKHLGRYVDEFAFRLNEGNVKNHTLTRLDSFVDGVAGKRLTYKALIQ